MVSPWDHDTFNVQIVLKDKLLRISLLKTCIIEN